MEEVLENNLSTTIKTQLADPHYLTETGMDIFNGVLITNEYGAVIATTDRVSSFRQTDRGWWQTVQAGGLVIGDIAYDEDSGLYGICTCATIEDELGNFIGGARAIVNVLPIAKDIELTDLGYETSEIKITTADGRLVFSSRAYAMLQDVSETEFFTHVDSERGHFSELEGNTERLFSYVTSEGFLEYSGNGWIMLLSHSSEEVLGPATELQTRILTVGMLTIAFGAIIAFTLSRSITRPVEEMAAVTRDMAKGRLGERISVRRQDELGRLAKSFNEMASELETMYTGLDNMVKERTVELENLNKKMSVLSSITRHDALNLMTVQRGLLGMAIESADDPALLDYLKRMDLVVENLIELMLFTNEYETIGIEAPKWISLSDALESGLKGLDLSGIIVDSHLDGVEAFADPMLPKVFHNLVGNSVKHGETVTRISFTYVEREDGLSVIMEDDGVGVPTERKDMIFQRKNQSGQPTHGMFLSAEILRMTRISIRETGKEGEGARFEILVPRGKYRLIPDPAKA